MPGFACPWPGQVVVAGTGQYASRGGGGAGLITNGSPGGVGAAGPGEGFSSRRQPEDISEKGRMRLLTQESAS